MAIDISGFQMTFSGLAAGSVSSFGVDFENYVALGNPRISALVGFPQQNLGTFDPDTFQIVYSRTNLAQVWALKETDFITYAINTMVPGTP